MIFQKTNALMIPPPIIRLVEYLVLSILVLNELGILTKLLVRIDIGVVAKRQQLLSDTFALFRRFRQGSNGTCSIGTGAIVGGACLDHATAASRCSR